MPIEFAHTNIVAEDWEMLVKFYCEVFGCVQVGPVRDLKSDLIDRGSGCQNAHLKGCHLKLPGHAGDKLTLEIYNYEDVELISDPPSNRKGFGHIAFRVDDVDEMLEKMLEHGGSRLGEPVSIEVPGAGSIRWVYARDPEGNIIELQKWG